MPIKGLTNRAYCVYCIYTVIQATKGGIGLHILIRNTSGAPIYEQIFGQIRDQILSGELKPGEALPSIRALAKDLRISVITTKRAYEELERAGYLVTVAGKGSFVAQQNLELMREAHLTEIESHLRAAAQLARGCGLSRQELEEMLTLQWEEEP